MSDDTRADQLADWPTAAELYERAGQSEPAWAYIPTLCDRVCPEHGRRCQGTAESHTHRCIFCAARRAIVES